VWMWVYLLILEVGRWYVVDWKQHKWLIVPKEMGRDEANF
jgi:hypothetical protein